MQCCPGGSNARVSRTGSSVRTHSLGVCRSGGSDRDASLVRLRESRLRRHAPRRRLRVRHRRSGFRLAAWTLSGTPQRAEYDNTRAKNGSLSGWIQGPATAAAAGVSAPAVMTSDGSEYRFWLYADTATENRYVSDTGSVFEMRTERPASVLVYTKRSATGYTANAYTAVGTYATGWTRVPRRPRLHVRHLHAVQARRVERSLDAAEVGRRPSPSPSPCARPPTAPPRPTCSSAHTRTRTCGSTTWPSPTAASSSPTPPRLPPPPRSPRPTARLTPGERSTCPGPPPPTTSV